MMSTILSLAIKYEHDVVAARQRARQIAWLLGFESQDQTRIATAVSEIARNAFTYAGGGRVEFAVEGRTAPQLFTVNVIDHGPGIAELPRILGGQYTSPTGMGIGILGARRLMDNFVITSGPGKGTVATLTKILPISPSLWYCKPGNSSTDAFTTRPCPSNSTNPMGEFSRSKML